MRAGYRIDPRLANLRDLIDHRRGQLQLGGTPRFSGNPLTLRQGQQLEDAEREHPRDLEVIFGTHTLVIEPGVADAPRLCGGGNLGPLPCHEGLQRGAIEHGHPYRLGLPERLGQKALDRLATLLGPLYLAQELQRLGTETRHALLQLPNGLLRVHGDAATQQRAGGSYRNHNRTFAPSHDWRH